MGDQCRAKIEPFTVISCNNNKIKEYAEVADLFR